MNMIGIVVNFDLEKMIVYGREVDVVNIIFGLIEFVEWMKNFLNVILVVYNGRKFDFFVFMSILCCLNMIDILFFVVFGFIDFLSVFKKVFFGQQNYK